MQGANLFMLRCGAQRSLEARTTVLQAAFCLFLGAPALAQGIPAADLKSGFDQMGPQTQGMQREDSLNPAMLWVAEGNRLWSAGPATGKPACAGCHGAVETLRGAAAGYPKLDKASSLPIDLMGRIQQCRAERQGAEPWARESRPLLALASLVGLQSRGMPVVPSADPSLMPFRAEGEKLFTQRLGQLNLSCAQCHDDNWGRRLGGSVIPQGHANGYPLYRLEWQGVGSLQRRIRSCLTGVRATPIPYGDPLLINLELYLATRAKGLSMEIPAVRP